MSESRAPLDRLEARLEQLAARVDELSRLVELGKAAGPPPADQAPAGAHEHARRKRRRHAGRAARVH